MTPLPTRPTLHTYTVCAKDYAGWTTCAEKSVGVPLTSMELKHIVPEDQGKMFIVAEDAGFWDAVPTEIPFRNENLFLASTYMSVMMARYRSRKYPQDVLSES